MQEPDYISAHLIGSISQTLQKRLPDIPMDRIKELAQQLTDMRMADLTNLHTMMTGRGLRNCKALLLRMKKIVNYTLSSG